jgi:hypothetical protein
MSDRYDWAITSIRKAEEERFFGTLELRFRDGRIELITKTETILPPEKPNGKTKEGLHV